MPPCQAAGRAPEGVDHQRRLLWRQRDHFSTTYTYDRRGRRQTAVRNRITTTWTYNDANLPLTESHAGGTLASLSMTWTYDNALRRDVVTAKNGSTTLLARIFHT